MKKKAKGKALKKINVEKKGECWSVEYLAVGSEIVITFIIILRV